MSEDIKKGGIDFDSFSIAGVNLKERGLELWAGAIPLVQTFWLYFFIPVFAVKIVSHAIGGPLGVILGIFIFAWAAFMTKPIFAAADKYQGGAHRIIEAKAAAVLINFGVFADIFS